MYGAGAQGLLEEGGASGALVTHVASHEEGAAIERAVRAVDAGATIETAARFQVVERCAGATRSARTMWARSQ